MVYPIIFMLLIKAVNVRADCERPIVGENRILTADSEQQSFPDGASVKFKCSTGFVPVRPSAPRSVTCNGTQWSELELQCKKRSCGSPGEIPNGKYLFEPTDGILFGAVITAECDEGYQLFGQPARHCRASGWDMRPPVCEAVKCTRPPLIADGVLEPVEESYDYGESVVYSCKRKFLLFGPSVLTCSANGTFQPDPPQCLLVSCGKPEIPNAERIQGKSPPYEYRNVVRYKCDEGYKMEGSDYLTCTEKGWDPAPPRCNVITCSNPPNITNGLFHPKKEVYEYKEKVYYSCDVGFRLSDASSTYISCTLDGTFEPLRSQCLEIFCHSPVIPHGVVSVSSQRHKFNDQVQINCDEGYRMLGSDILTCKEHDWSPSPPRCLEMTCDEPEVPNGFIVQGKSSTYKYKWSVQVQCYTGYTMEGSGVLSCEQTGWSPLLPQCNIVSCVAPPVINHGQFRHVKEVYTYRQTVTYSCERGFSLHGASTISCTADGRFQDPPQCLAVACDKPNIINGFILEGEATFYGLDSSVLVQCNSWYTMTGSDHLTCNENGWDPPPPQCHSCVINGWIWIPLGLALPVVLILGVCGCCWKKKPKCLSSKKESCDIVKPDHRALVASPSIAPPAEEFLLHNVS